MTLLGYLIFTRLKKEYNIEYKNMAKKHMCSILRKKD